MNLSFWSMISDFRSARGPLPVDREYMSPTREGYPSLSQESSSLATGFPRGIESPPRTEGIQQGPTSVHPPDALEIPDEEYETRRMPSRTQPEQVEIKPGADGKPQGLVRSVLRVWFGPSTARCNTEKSKKTSGKWPYIMTSFGTP